MEDIYEKEGTAVFKSKDVTLSGQSLMEYMDDLVARIVAIKCLYHEDLESSANKAGSDS